MQASPCSASTVEGGFLASGIIAYAGTAAGQWFPPVRIIALWFGFGTLPHASLGWLSGRWVLQPCSAPSAARSAMLRAKPWARHRSPSRACGRSA